MPHSLLKHRQKKNILIEIHYTKLGQNAKSISDIASAVDTSKGYVREVVDEFNREGLVRESDGEHHSETLVNTTEYGAEQVEEIENA